MQKLLAVLSIDDEESDLEVLNDRNERQAPKGGQKESEVNLNANKQTGKRMHSYIRA